MTDRTLEVPAWLNLDLIVPPELRDEISGLAEHIEAKRQDLDLDARRVQEVLARIGSACIPGHVRAIVYPLSGVHRLWEVVSDIATKLQDALERPAGSQVDH
jgi:hypothetical protein